ncbi:MAG: archaetidylserine decarboxylase [Spirochaetes bacterium]|nr:archaetidylserine decarboxylase [Spirochaetota bacterium]
MKKNRSLSIFLFKITPTIFLSRIFGYAALIPLPAAVMASLLRWYSKKFGVTAEYIQPVTGFRNFNEFFTRRLKPGARPVDSGSKSIVSPVDARVDQYGEIDGNSILQAKGVHYRLDDLIPSESAGDFTGGSFITLYLSPGDYHRIHSPAGGRITGYMSIPGRLYTVQEYMVKGLAGLFSINERLITFIESRSRIAVCKIGAMNVGRITLSYEKASTNRFPRKKREIRYQKKSMIEVGPGDEIGAFNLGSTIILIFQKGAVKFEKLTPGSKIRMGEKIASFK